MGEHRQVVEFTEAATPEALVRRRRGRRLLLALLATPWLALLVPPVAWTAGYWALVAHAFVACCWAAFLVAFLVIVGWFVSVPSAIILLIFAFRDAPTRRWLCLTALVVFSFAALCFGGQPLASRQCARARIARAAPLIAGIEQFTAQHGRPPTELAELPYGTLNPLSETGAGEPYEYRAEGQAWLLTFGDVAPTFLADYGWYYVHGDASKLLPDSFEQRVQRRLNGWALYCNYFD